jgi:cysteinyl-tRNA synthetase
VYFSVAAYPGYGELSGQRPEELIAGSRVEPGEGKRAPLDFALWKATKPGEDTAWDSPWGRGRPGWHIECSAMAHAELGEDFDVHGGGLDLIFPHHENERAQSEAAGERFARVWMHNGMLRLTGEKMSKSLGNIEGLAEALERVGRETLLVFFAQAHYRSPVDYSDSALEQASATAAGLREALRNARRYAAGGGNDATPPGDAADAFERFAAYMADDLDTPRALAELHGLARDINVAVAGGEADPSGVAAAADLLVRALDVLGLASLDSNEEASAEALALAEERATARSAGDYARADELRDRIAALGFSVRDTPQGPQVVALDG